VNRIKYFSAATCLQPRAPLLLDSSQLFRSTNEHQIQLSTYCLLYGAANNIHPLRNRLEEGNCNTRRNVK
jgi:hypothetical protein